jgi:hypothetical protein
MKTINILNKCNFSKRCNPILILLALSIIACQELDITDPNSPTVEEVPVQSLVTGVEAGLRIDHGIYLRVVAIFGREAYYFEPADPRYTGELLFGPIDPGGFLVERPWAARYRVVANCNFLLEKAADLSGASQNGVIGFAKTMMAYQLLLNLNYLDDNGIKLDFSGILDNFVTKEAAFQAIETMLDDANTNLGNAGSSFSFTLSSGFEGFDTPVEFAKFNRALRARVAIYQLKNNDAITALNASFVDESADLDLGVYNVYGTGLGDLTNPIFESPEAAFVKLMAHPTFETDADSGDTRFSSKTIIRADSTKFDDLTSDLGVTTTSGSTDPLPIIRNEELLLIRAEANIGIGNLPSAENDINVIRAAAGLAPVTLTAGNALDQVLHERRYSLFMEGHRWIDMRRNDKLNDLPIDRANDTIIDKMPRPETEESG